MDSFDAISARLGIRRPTGADCLEFITLMQASADLHRPWADFADTAQRYHAYLLTRNRLTDDGFLLCDRHSGRIVGVVNLNCIVRRAFHCAYLGYNIGAPYARKGLMTEGLKLVMRFAFTEMGLHRLEANIQPENVASSALVRKCGFRKEGFSPKYLKVLGEWRDHERWAILADELNSSSQTHSG